MYDNSDPRDVLRRLATGPAISVLEAWHRVGQRLAGTDASSRAEPPRAGEGAPLPLPPEDVLFRLAEAGVQGIEAAAALHHAAVQHWVGGMPVGQAWPIPEVARVAAEGVKQAVTSLKRGVVMETKKEQPKARARIEIESGATDVFRIQYRNCASEAQDVAVRVHRLRREAPVAIKVEKEKIEKHVTPAFKPSAGITCRVEPGREVHAEVTIVTVVLPKDGKDGKDGKAPESTLEEGLYTLDVGFIANGVSVGEEFRAEVVVTK